MAKGGVCVHFEGIEQVIIDAIGQCTGVIGCVAWLRSPRIMRALAKVPCNIAITNDVNLPQRQYKSLKPREKSTRRYASWGWLGVE